MKKYLLAIVFLLMMALWSCAEEKVYSEPAGGFVHGIIRDNETFQPIDSVEATLYMKLAHGFRDKDYSNIYGDYLVFSGFGAGDHIVVFSKEGYATDSIDIYIIENDTITANILLAKN